MIVAFQPGGSIKTTRVVLQPNETLPNRHNVPEAVVYREHPETYEWILMKPLGSVLPEDSPLLSQPGLPEFDISHLTTDPNCDTTYEHADIIAIDEPDDGSKQ